jgi:hypothetical protein
MAKKSTDKYRYYFTKTMWIAVDGRGRTYATWYRGCAQPYLKWRRIVKSLGWKPIACGLVRRKKRHGG